MPEELFRVGLGFADDKVQYLSGSGLPDSELTRAAPVGSSYSDITTGKSYKKINNLGDVSDWEKLLDFAEFKNLTQYTHAQDIASTEWVITHNLGKYPTVLCLDSAYDEIEGSIIYSSLDQLTVQFNSPTGGMAYLH
jgi:hypothetical protein